MDFSILIGLIGLLILSILVIILFCKETQHLNKIKGAINERLECNFKDFNIGDKDFSSVLKEIFSYNGNDVRKNCSDISNNILEINFYDNIKNKSKKELICLKKSYEREIIATKALIIDNVNSVNILLIIISILVGILSMFFTFISLIDKTKELFNKNFETNFLLVILIFLIFVCIYNILTLTIQYNYSVKSKNIIYNFEKIIKTFILDIEQRLYELEHKISDDDGYAEYNIKIKPKNS